MTEIKGIPPALAKTAKDAAKKDERDRGEARGQHTRLATPDEEAKIKAERHKGDTVNHADDNDIERCRTNKDLETHTRLARPDEEAAIKAKHAKDRAKAAGAVPEAKSAKEMEAEANEAAASVARRQALGGV